MSTPPGTRRALSIAAVVVVLGAAAALAWASIAPLDSSRWSGVRTGAPAGACPRPYDRASPWHRAIPQRPKVLKRSRALVRAIANNGLPLTSDVDRYTIAVHITDDETPSRTVELSGWFSSYDRGDGSRKGHGWSPTVHGVPVPDDVDVPAGSDGQVVFWNPRSGVEYGFWRFRKDSHGHHRAQNGYRYHTTTGYHGRFADGKAGRGAGLPYLAGLVRRCELARGRIGHALAFAYDSPSPAFVYPASASDGAGVRGVDLPEGARLQLSPRLGEARFDAWGLSPEGKAIARALQRYGMYVVDNSGSSKIFLEARPTAAWDGDITRTLVSAIPWKEFRVVAPPRRRPPR